MSIVFFALFRVSCVFRLFSGRMGHITALWGPTVIFRPLACLEGCIKQRKKRGSTKKMTKNQDAITFGIGHTAKGHVNRTHFTYVLEEVHIYMSDDTSTSDPPHPVKHTHE